jgi:voltage-gated potassium channel
MDTMVIEPLPSRGQPRTAADAAALERYDRFAKLPIILAAVLPLILTSNPGTWVGLVVDVGSWVVFLVDFVVHERRLTHYLGTRLGKFDLLVVILTAPWFLLPGAHAGGFVVVLRLARLVRLLIASRGAKRLFERLGGVVAVALAVVLVGASVAYYAEHPTNPEFKTYGDSLWWAIVTLTTVGYGDIVPETSGGRWAGVFIMVTGVAVLGLLAGTLASFFRVGSDADAVADAALTPRAAGESAAPAADVAAADGGDEARVLRELAALRTQVTMLDERISTLLGTRPGGTGT